MPTSLEDYGPFDAGIGASRTEDFWRALFGVAIASGVLDGQLNEFAVAQRGAGANMSVDAATGRCLIRGHWGESTVLKNLAITAAHATLARIDLVILRADFTNNRVEVDVLTGTAAGSPTVPALTRDTTKWEIAIGQIAVAAAASSILSANITDTRPFMSYDGPRRFPSTAARDLEITAPQEGDECWVLGTYDYRFEYSGAAWVVILARGAGTPEANVTAGIGAMYERTDGSTGTTLYVKETGAAATGWAAVGAPPTISGDSDQIVLGVEIFS